MSRLPIIQPKVSPVGPPHPGPGQAASDLMDTLGRISENLAEDARLKARIKSAEELTKDTIDAEAAEGAAQRASAERTAAAGREQEAKMGAFGAEQTAIQGAADRQARRQEVADRHTGDMILEKLRMDHTKELEAIQRSNTLQDERADKEDARRAASITRTRAYMDQLMGQSPRLGVEFQAEAAKRGRQVDAADAFRNQIVTMIRVQENRARSHNMLRSIAGELGIPVAGAQNVVRGKPGVPSGGPSRKDLGLPLDEASDAEDADLQVEQERVRGSAGMAEKMQDSANEFKDAVAYAEDMQQTFDPAELIAAGVLNPADMGAYLQQGGDAGSILAGRIISQFSRVFGKDKPPASWDELEGLINPATGWAAMQCLERMSDELQTTLEAEAEAGVSWPEADDALGIINRIRTNFWAKGGLGPYTQAGAAADQMSSAGVLRLVAKGDLRGALVACNDLYEQKQALYEALPMIERVRDESAYKDKIGVLWRELSAAEGRGDWDAVAKLQADFRALVVARQTERRVPLE